MSDIINPVMIQNRRKRMVSLGGMGLGTGRISIPANPERYELIIANLIDNSGPVFIGGIPVYPGQVFVIEADSEVEVKGAAASIIFVSEIVYE